MPPDHLEFPHGVILDRLREHLLVPFLGSASSFVGAVAETRLPDGRSFARELLDGIPYPGKDGDPLTKIAQYLEEGPADRQYLLKKVNRRFAEDLAEDYRTAFMDFLEEIPVDLIPRLIITTNYDVLVERVLQRRGINYLAMSQVLRGNRYAGRWICYSDLSCPLSRESILPLRRLEDHLSEQQQPGSAPVVWVYKVHGTARVWLDQDILDSILLTEGDHIEFLSRDILRTIPAQLLEILRKCSLLFLGYALEDWNFRILLRRLCAFRHKSSDQDKPRHWAFLREVEPIEELFWKFRGVNLYPYSLDTCLRVLRAALRAN